MIDCELKNAPSVVTCDVCIVGAGAAGLYLARQFSQAHMTVALVEAGARVPSSASEMGMVPRFTSEEYSGATAGRMFGVGGTTVRWGGVLIPHGEHDLPSSDYWDESWSTVIDAVAKHGTSVLRELGVRFADAGTFYRKVTPLEKECARSMDLLAVHSLYLPFRKRNFSKLLGPTRGVGSVNVLTNCVVGDWESRKKADGETEFIAAIGTTKLGRKTRIEAKSFIVCCGALETTRMLLEIRDRTPTALAPETELGLGLSDHLSVPLAVLGLGKGRPAFFPKFEKNCMHAIRFCGGAGSLRKPRFFVHCVYDFQSAGYCVVKEVMRCVQARKMPKLNYNEILAGADDLLRIAWSRYVRKALYISASTRVTLQLDIEQKRELCNRIVLGSELDVYGRKAMEIEWSIGPSDYRNIQDISEWVLNAWPRGERWPPLGERRYDRASMKPYDAYHPVGTCRMGRDKGAVVDYDLKVCGTSNLSVVSTAVLPSAGSANPTFSMLCLGHALAERMTR